MWKHDGRGHLALGFARYQHALRGRMHDIDWAQVSEDVALMLGLLLSSSWLVWR